MHLRHVGREGSEGRELIDALVVELDLLQEAIEGSEHSRELPWDDTDELHGWGEVEGRARSREG